MVQADNDFMEFNFFDELLERPNIHEYITSFRPFAYSSNVINCPTANDLLSFLKTSKDGEM